jgi:Flp pilus assembly protein TadG
MLRSSRCSSRRRAVAAVEFAICLPPIMALLVGIWEVGRLIEIKQVMTNAAREGGRQAATGQLTNTQVQAVVTQYLKVAGLPTSNVTVTVTNLTSPGVDVSQANYLDNIQVTVTMPFGDVTWSLLGMFVPSSTTVSAQVQWVSVVDKPYPSAPVPPVG